MDFSNPDKLTLLSPFELKDALIQVASNPDRAMLNAGRGNPNFLATTPRHGFFQFGLFAMSEAERSYIYMDGVGGFPQRDGIEARFEIFAKANASVDGIRFIEAAVSYVRDQLGLSAAAFIYEMCEAILGCNYPVPDRMLRLSEKIVGQYIRREMLGEQPFVGNFDMYAVEGGTAAMTYIFNSLRENHLLKAGDTIALGMPIFTPYIEIPHLNDYQLVELMIDAPPENNWQFSKKELDKLLDPKVKAFFLVNPSNPPSVKINDETLAYIAEIVKKRPDLIILTDDVYGTFADNFVSLFAVCPYNTILVYSFSKYFGATGWRMGVIATHEKNILDDKIAALPEARRQELDLRYNSITTEPRALKFIDRLVADSRTVALNHTAGLSTPVQAQMTLFSLYSLMDEPENYKKSMKRIVLRRKEALYQALGLPLPVDVDSVSYYHLLDLETLATQMYGADFAKWMVKRLKPNEALFRLAEETGVNPTSTSSYVPQKDFDGSTLPVLPPTWGGMTLAGQSTVITQAQSANLPNKPFQIDDVNSPVYMPSAVITRDLVHRFYNNQMQINGGKNDKFTAYSDAGGLSMGYYDGSKMKLWNIAKQYALADNFFMGTFGGSFLTHQYLICACAPTYPNADAATSPAKNNISAVNLDANGNLIGLTPGTGMPTSVLNGAPVYLKDSTITPKDAAGMFYAVNTMQPPFQPSGNVAATVASYADPSKATTLPAQTQTTIGDQLTAKGVNWAWYAGAWNAAVADAPNASRSVIYSGKIQFQPHHQPFNYYSRFDPASSTGAAERASHLKDFDASFLQDAAAGTLPAVAFYKPQGNLNQHPGYANVSDGDAHIADVIAKLQASPQWKNMLIVVTYDENGGFWDHVAPPKGDRWGPGTRLPAILVSPYAKKGFVDHTQYDTASILRFITNRYSLPVLPGITARDKALVANGGKPMGDLTGALTPVPQE